MNTSLTSAGGVKDENGHSLTTLWAKYDKAERDDRPKQQAAILEQIKKEASSKRLAWDFYDACTEYVSVKSSANWKLSESLEEAKDKELKEFGEPIVIYFDGKGGNPDAMLAYVKENRSRLEKSYNPEFYSRDYLLDRFEFGEALPKLLRCDWDYVLWSLFGCEANNSVTVALMEERFGGSYPFDALYEYASLKADTETMQAFAGKHSGDAVGVFAESWLLQDRFNSLNRNGGKSDDYLSLNADCSKLIKRIGSYSGDEKTIASCSGTAKNIAGYLKAKSLRASAEDGIVTVLLQNLSNVRIKVKSGSTILMDKTLDNTAKSFYIRDTMRVELPKMDDGSYEIECRSGKESLKFDYDKYTLSIASRRDSRGLGIYVADYISGEPAAKCSLTLYDRSDKPVASAEDFSIDGFTAVPEAIESKLSSKKWGYSLQASFRDADGSLRSSRKHSVSGSFSDRPVSDTRENTSCMLITDRKAFNPEETVHYKVILYKGRYEYSVAGEGVKLLATLSDAEGKQLASQELVTGEFGSAAGEFTLGKSSRGGLYSIEISRGGKHLAGTSVLVDEFVTPTFELNWTPDRRLYLAGDGVSVRGNVKSYSGHSLSSATAVYTVKEYGTVRDSGALELDANGDFEVRFKSGEKNYSWYTVTVKVTDATGETQEFSKSVTVYGSLGFSTCIDGTDKGSFELKDGDSGRKAIISGPLSFRVSSSGEDGDGSFHPSFSCSYTLRRGSETLASGSAKGGEQVTIALSGKQAGLYVLEVEGRATADNGKEYTEKDISNIMYVPKDAEALDYGVRSFFRETEGDALSLQIGSSCGPVWAVAELYGDGNVLLDRQMVKLAGGMEKNGTLATVSFARKADYPSEVKLNVLWFRDKDNCRYSRSFSLPKTEFSLPLSFSRFLDTTAPGRDYSFSIKTSAGVECAASVFDAATETLRANVWSAVRPAERPLPYVSYDTTEGVNGDDSYPIIAYGSRRFSLMTKNSPVAMAAVEEAEVAYDSMVLSSASNDASNANESAESGGYIRENFANTIAWEPFLRSDADGNIKFSFRNADKLSTYYVQLYAHDKSMHNATLRREMTVTLPVKIAVVEPQHLYEGDRYVARVTVSNGSDAEVSGVVAARFIEGRDYGTAKTLVSESKCLSIKAGESASFDCSINAPAISELGLLVSFTPKDTALGSDAVFVSIPVSEAAQTITEAHSALLLAGADREALIASLRSEFVNLPGAEASVREISILDMLREAVPAKLEAKGEDILSLSEVLYADWLLSKIPGAVRLSDKARNELVGKIAACHNSDGGFGWFAEMYSSPVVTAVVLERFARMGAACPEEIRGLLESAVRYTDIAFISDSARPIWCGGISLGQYLYLRSLYASVPLDSKAFPAKTLKELRKSAKAYLVPAKARGLNGEILDKARRVQTLKALLESEGGAELASSFGIRAFTSARLRKSMDKDILSLTEYAQPHKSGGTYYPNAVMPWRGLLESELYAHSLLCNLLADCGQSEIAEGIRLWIMVQKETQKWEDDPAYIEAVASVLDGSEATLQTRVIALSGTVRKPFGEIEASGNGFTVRAEYWRDGSLLGEGDTLRVGDKITAIYQIWNEENRSFVKLTAPRCAALRPVEQKSGSYGWRARPLSVRGWVSFTPQGYRSVLADRTEFWFDSYPEEKTGVSEDFFVTQEGRFQAPAVEIESLYAPHYRATGRARAAIEVRAAE